MKVSDAFPSSHLKADDLDGGDVTYTITSYSMETLGQGKDAETKPVLKFLETKLDLICNRTNANVIAGIYGSEMDDWIGKKITLYATEVQFGADMVLAIRVRMRKPAAAAPAPAASSRPATAAPAAGLVATAKRAAWDAIREANPGADDTAILTPWRAVIAAVSQEVGKTALEFGVAEWARVKEAIEAEASLTPPAPAESDIPI